MKINSVQLDRFSVFKQLELSFAPGINVLIGTNGTGKSHLLKLLYGTLKTSERHGNVSADEYAVFLKQKLTGLFRPSDENIGRLLTRSVGGGTAKIKVQGDQAESAFSISNRGKVQVKVHVQAARPKPLFIPSRETLSIYKGFIQAYENRELNFDETYYDLCKALSGNALRGAHGEAVSGLAEPLESILGGKVRIEGDVFRAKLATGDMEADLLSEGFRKIACLIHLIRNGSLTDKGVLFWDEPEANLNPKLTMVVRDTLLKLAEFGTQIFIATHDYLLSQELSILSEYKKATVPIKFYSLSHGVGGVVCQEGDTLVDIEDNPILDEFSDHYDRETKLIHE